MIKKKLMQTCVLSLSVLVLSSGYALADSGGGQPAAPLPVKEPQPVAQDRPVSQPAPDQPVSDKGTMPQPPENSAVYQKQREIDQYVFEQHKQEIEAKGFTVTHTGPMDAYVEVGITPYTQENADYLYGIFGRDMVKVVEGQQAVLLAADGNAAEPAAPPVADISTTSAKEESAKNSSSPLPVIYTAGGVILLGGIFALTRKARV